MCQIVHVCKYNLPQQAGSAVERIIIVDFYSCNQKFKYTVMGMTGIAFNVSLNCSFSRLE